MQKHSLVFETPMLISVTITGAFRDPDLPMKRNVYPQDRVKLTSRLIHGLSWFRTDLSTYPVVECNLPLAIKGKGQDLRNENWISGRAAGT